MTDIADHPLFKKSDLSRDQRAIVAAAIGAAGQVPPAFTKEKTTNLLNALAEIDQQSPAAIVWLLGFVLVAAADTACLFAEQYDLGLERADFIRAIAYMAANAPGVVATELTTITMH
jgi:hypothetical protein